MLRVKDCGLGARGRSCTSTTSSRTLRTACTRLSPSVAKSGSPGKRRRLCCFGSWSPTTRLTLTAPPTPCPRSRQRKRSVCSRWRHGCLTRRMQPAHLVLRQEPRAPLPPLLLALLLHLHTQQLVPTSGGGLLPAMEPPERRGRVVAGGAQALVHEVSQAASVPPLTLYYHGTL